MLMQGSSDCNVRNNGFDRCKVKILDSENSVLYWNGFYNGSGIVVERSSAISVFRNEIIASSDNGIVVEMSSTISVFNNEIIASSDNGILVRHSNQISISKNTISASVIAGIATSDSQSCNYTANNISHCRNGIQIMNGSSSLLTHNYIYNQTDYGIRIDSGSDNWIYANLLASEGVGFFLDDGNFNHWDDGVFLGNFMVGITEGVFEIDGSAGNADYFARPIDPVPVREPIICSNPIIFKINENEGTLAWVVWLRGDTGEYRYGIETYSVGDLEEEWTGPCTISINISNLTLGYHEYSLDLWIGYVDYTAGEIHLSNVSFYYPGYYSSLDEDADGMPNVWEIDNGLNPLIDDSTFDPDSDDLTNIGEFLAGTDPHNPDSDSDLIVDGWEVTFGLNPLFDDADEDLDSDGLTNLQEFQIGTYPNDRDSDNDLMDDLFEVTYELTPLEDDHDGDLDNDGLTNLQEFQIGTAPNNGDSDRDLMPDGWEVLYSLNPLFDDSTQDFDLDDLDNLNEYLQGTNPIEEDTDDDSITDGWEVMYGFNPMDASDALLDLDSDTLTNLQEFELGTDPTNPDSDSDSFPDVWEVRNGFDPTNPSVSLLHYIVLHMPLISISSMVVIFLMGVLYFRHKQELIQLAQKEDEDEQMLLEELLD
jgi:hypothetical protein